MDEDIIVNYGAPINSLIERDLEVESSFSILAFNSDVLRRIEDEDRLYNNCVSDISPLKGDFMGCAYL